MMVELDRVSFAYSSEEEDGEAGSETDSVGGISDSSLEVSPGECVVLCGRSGSGKSTLLRLISGLAPCMYEGQLSGKIHIAGKPSDVLSAEERTRLMGVVLQDPRSQFFMSDVGDELAFSAENLGIPADDIKLRIHEVAETFCIKELLGCRIDTLSSGQKQRVALAAAMLLSPELLLLDEPIANLDNRGAEELVETLRKLKSQGTTIIISEHRVHAFLGVADRYVHVDGGTVRHIWSKQCFSTLDNATLASFGMRAVPNSSCGAEDVMAYAAEHPTDTEPALAVRRVGYRYRTSTGGVFDFTANFPLGQVTGLLGENGVGKTTLGRILSGMVLEERGEIRFDGAFLSQAERRQLSHFVMQDADYQLYADSVEHELLLGRRVTDELRTRALEALDAFGLTELRYRHPASLSGGEKQRLTLAVAYSGDARLVILDEPTSGLDGEGVRQVAAWARKLASAGKCVVVITHDRELTELCCDRVVHMRGQKRRHAPMNQKQGIPRLLELAGQKKALLIWSGILSTISVFLLLISFYSVYQVMNELLQHAADSASLDSALMMQWAVFGLVAMLVGYGFTYAAGLCAHTAAFKIMYGVRVKLADHIGRLPLGFLNRNASGKIKKIAELDVDTIEVFIAHQLPDMVSTAALLATTAIAMLYLNPYFALAALVPIGVGLFAQYRLMMGKAARRELVKYFDALEDISASGSQYVKGMPSVKVFGQTVFSFRRFHEDMLRYRDNCISYTDRNQNGYVVYRVLVLSLICFILPVGVFLLGHNPGDVELASVLMLFLVLAPGISVLLFKLVALSGGMLLSTEGIRRIDDILAEEVLPEVRAGKAPDGCDICFEKVTFSYDADERSPEVLHGISFTAPQGELTALVGPSGSGKSTIAQLIPRFWDVQSGSITLGGVDIRNMAPQTLMDTVSFVFQDAFLFSDTVYRNIHMGNPRATADDVLAAARAARCHEFIEHLPDGYDTLLGQGGVYLSGGEEQRICVARALLKDAPVLVLDEATAFADPENEQLMQQALSVLMQGKTVVIIAHRLSTIQNAGNILVLQNGSIIESGRHEALLERQGLYARMWAAHRDTSSWALRKKRGRTG
ncbi:MAG: ATP-binding cassette domain-containing protein [Coriobacteriales bacterium]|nr:ATP-binding cassette domain-containing protein [Coriobacteriales bacterium]